MHSELSKAKCKTPELPTQTQKIIQNSSEISP